LKEEKRKVIRGRKLKEVFFLIERRRKFFFLGGPVGGRVLLAKEEIPFFLGTFQRKERFPSFARVSQRGDSKETRGRKEFSVVREEREGLFPFLGEMWVVGGTEYLSSLRKEMNALNSRTLPSGKKDEAFITERRRFRIRNYMYGP